MTTVEDYQLETARRQWGGAGLALLGAGLSVAMDAGLRRAAGADGGREWGSWTAFVAAQLVLGPLVGLAVGWSGSRAADLASARGWAGSGHLRLVGAGVALCAFGGAELVAGNGFLAAFAAGAVVAARGRVLRQAAGAFVDAEGTLMSLAVFIVFGAVLLPAASDGMGAAHLLYALLSLTVVRMLPVALCLIGTGLHRQSVAFLGWFGPRGLASIIYVLVLSNDGVGVETDGIASVVFLTVAASILLHGVTAAPLAAAYGRWSAARSIDEAGRP